MYNFICTHAKLLVFFRFLAGNKKEKIEVEDKIKYFCINYIKNQYHEEILS